MPEEVRQTIADQREAFRKKFGRDPGPEDPVFFDPDAGTPQEISEENYNRELNRAAVAAGIVTDLSRDCILQNKSSLVGLFGM
jgi:hypothetical protein